VSGHYLKSNDIPPMQAAIDEPAEVAGREPSEIKRIVNVMALEGDPASWADELRGIAALGFQTLLVGVPRTRRSASSGGSARTSRPSCVTPPSDPFAAASTGCVP
jgi:hypothetical protein